MEHDKQNLVTEETTASALMLLDPEFGKLALQVGGEVWGRPGLTQKERAYLSIGANVCNQTLSGPFKLHVDMALRAGATPVQVREVLLHMAVYASFPKALEAIRCLRSHFESKGIAL